MKTHFKGPGEWLAQVKKIQGNEPQVKTPKKAEPDKRAAKLSKDAVHYRRATGAEQCGSCSMFRAGSPAHCTLVAGDIEADHVCDRWAAKARSLTPLARRKRAHA